ncbi:MAG: FkbM family methyltransferase [Rhodospirillaceae bacterium]
MPSLVEICGHTFYLPALNAGSTVIDLGASTAAFSAGVTALAGCTCRCAEAAPRNFAAIAETPHLTKHFCALGGIDGLVTLHIPDDEFHWGSVDAPAGFVVTETVEVPGRTLDTLLAEIGVDRVDLLKVDIEGAEIAMFDAASDATLQSCAQITVEFHDFMDPGQAADVARVVRRLEGLGFDTVVFTRRHHGDVLFLDRRKLGLGGLDVLWFRTLVKYGRGLKRMIGRFVSAERAA